LLQCTTLVREFKPIGMTLKQSEAETLFQEPDLLTHGGLCDVQLFRGKREAAETRGRLKRAQSIQVGWTTRHLHYPNVFLATALDQIAGLPIQCVQH
jgi:hypothetical protein